MPRLVLVNYDFQAARAIQRQSVYLLADEGAPGMDQVSAWVGGHVDPIRTRSVETLVSSGDSNRFYDLREDG